MQIEKPAECISLSSVKAEPDPPKRACKGLSGKAASSAKLASSMRPNCMAKCSWMHSSSGIGWPTSFLRSTRSLHSRFDVQLGSAVRLLGFEAAIGLKGQQGAQRQLDKALAQQVRERPGQAGSSWRMSSEPAHGSSCDRPFLKTRCNWHCRGSTIQLLNCTRAACCIPSRGRTDKVVKPRQLLAVHAYLSRSEHMQG